jgi:hypothetical protein
VLEIPKSGPELCFAFAARFILNANYSVVRPAVKLRVADCVADRVWLAIPQPAEWQRIGNQIDAATIFCGTGLRKRVVS